MARRKRLCEGGDAAGPDDVRSEGSGAGPPSEGQAAYYSRMEEEFDPTTLTQPIYTRESEMLQDWIKRLWDEYCQFRGKDPLATLRLIPIAVLYNFFHWVLRKRSDTLRAASTLQTYWNTFCLVRKKETGCHHIDPQIKSQMHGIRQRLAADFKLTTEKKPKPIMRAEDEFELLKTLWTSPEMALDHERLRVQLALILQLAGITGNRPGALLGLRYENLKVTLLRDPAGSDRPRVLIEFTFTKTKGYLGLKDANTFGIPDVPSEPCLLLCPQVMLLSLVFADEAFKAPTLRGPDQLFRLRVPQGLNQQELPFKDSMSAVPLFRRLETTVHGRQVSPMAAATDNWLRGALASLGDVTGFEVPVRPYCFRRGNGEALDNSSLISDSQRNLILQHASSAVFQHNYLSRYITQDTQAIYRGLDPQTAVMRAASGMSRTIDPRRPRRLSDRQLDQARRHPEVRLLLRRRNALAQQIRAQHGTISRTKGTEVHETYLRAHRRYQSKKKAAQKALMAEVRSTYRARQAVLDIETQLTGPSTKPEEGATSDPRVGIGFSRERRRAVAALFTFAATESAEECKRRAEAVDAVSALSRRQELRSRKIYGSAKPPDQEDGGRMDIDAAAPEGPETKARFPIECSSTQCIFCLGNSELPLEQRNKKFRNRDGLKRHFYRKHLRHHPDGVAIDCPHPQCDARLTHKMHLQNHAATVHNTFT